MKLNKKQREALKPVFQAIDDAGGTVEVEPSGKMHIKLTVELAGKTKKFFASSTPSDRRGRLNFVSDVKKFLRSESAVT